MNVYEYLKQVRKLDCKIANAKNELRRLETLATSAGAIDYTKERVQNGRTEQEPSYVYTLDQIYDHAEKLTKMIGKYDELRHTVYLQIESLQDGLQARVLYLHYLEFKSLERISIEINYSFYGTRSIFRAGIRAFKSKYGDEYDV